MRKYTSNEWYKQLLGCILIIAVSLLTSGCWDQQELEERRIVLAIAVDQANEGLGPEQGKDVTKVESFYQPHGSKHYRLSLQILNIMPAQGNSISPQGEIKTYVISNTGESLFEMVRDMLGQVNQRLWFEHVQTIVISEKAAKQSNLQFLIDFFRRERGIRRRTNILITSGEARSLLEYEPPNGEPSGIFIANSLRLYRKNSHIPGWYTDVRAITEGMNSKDQLLIARISLEDNIVKLGGMVLFKDGKLIGYLDEYATKGENFLRGTEKSTVVTVDCPDHPGKITVFEVFRHKTTLIPHIEDGQIYYTLHIDMLGNLGESQCAKQHNIMDIREVQEVEEAVGEEVKRNVLYTLYQYQHLKIDGSIFGKKLSIHEPLVWAQVKDRWNDEIFPHIPLYISVHVGIENIGVHK